MAAASVVPIVAAAVGRAAAVEGRAAAGGRAAAVEDTAAGSAARMAENTTRIPLSCLAESPPDLLVVHSFLCPSPVVQGI